MSIVAAVPFIVTVGVALLGYVATYLNNLRLAQRKDRLDRVDRQLRELYGPLLALASASTSTWEAFIESSHQAGRFGEGSTIRLTNPKDGALWRHWMKHVFMPLNEQMAGVVSAHADLLEDSAMPPCLLQLAAHVNGYRGVIAAWDAGDTSDNFSLIRFPGSELLTYAQSGYNRLKARQASLLGNHSDVAA